jgi:tetraacyldisaccharide 4'-kinase
MTMASQIEGMWWHRETPPLLLRWASSVYGLINRRNLKKRAAESISPGIPLISIGNITVGGSGKTPFVIWLCGELLQRGYKPVVLCRGDGGKLKAPKHILPDDAASEVGDEALLLALRCNAPVIAGRDRVAGAQLAATLGDVIILDDGFQYLQLKRNCDIVLIPTEGIGNGHLLPAGPLRETLDALGRAHLVVRTGSDEGATLSAQREWRWQAEALAVRPLYGGETPGESPCLALAGIARAERFFSAASKNANIKETMRFADHHPYDEADVARILSTGLPVLTTEKDAVKLLPLWPKDKPLSVLPISGKGEEGLPEAIIKTMLSHRKI